MRLEVQREDITSNDFDEILMNTNQPSLTLCADVGNAYGRERPGFWFSRIIRQAGNAGRP
jgi:hypothetical protein